MLRKPNSIPKKDTVIEDPAMEPFFIAKSSAGGYTIYERVTKGAKNTEYIDSLCYPSTFNSALKKVSKLLLDSKNNRHYKTVKEYLSHWEVIQKSMEKLTSVDL